MFMNMRVYYVNNTTNCFRRNPGTTASASKPIMAQHELPATLERASHLFHRLAGVARRVPLAGTCADAFGG